MVVAFCVTAVWDVILRWFSEGKLKFMGIEKLSWVVALRPYFEYHTVLSAAAIAGVVGAGTSVIINKFTPKIVSESNMFYLLWVAFVSAVVGIPMRYSGMFPYLKAYYYDPLPITTIFSDALSGVIVALTMMYIRSTFLVTASILYLAYINVNRSLIA
tara:strand:- start:326 stop:799 length:474 start_codon:yes stop_codon:yes gene_type:complete